MKRISDGVNKEKWIHWVTIRDKSITFLLIAGATIYWKEDISAKNEVALEDVADFHWDSTFKLISLEVKKIEISNSWNISMPLMRSIHQVQTLNRSIRNLTWKRLQEKKNFKNTKDKEENLKLAINQLEIENMQMREEKEVLRQISHATKRIKF